MTNWKVLVSIGAAAFILAGLLLFIRVLNKPDPSAMLSAKLESKLAAWAAEKVPLNERVINLIIGDAGVGEDVLSLSPQAKEESLLDRLKGLLGMNTAPRPVNISNPYTKAFGQDKNTVAWTFDGFSKAQEKDVIEELARNIVKAHDSEVVLNIVAQGEVGAAVLKSVKSLEGQVRGGVQVGVNSLVLLGMDTQKLKAYDPGYFAKAGRPQNVVEWANVYSEGSLGGMRLEDSTIEMYSAKYDGARVPGRFLVNLLPAESRMNSSGLPIRLDAFASAIIGVFGREGGLESYVTQQQWLEEKQAEELRKRAAEEEVQRQAEAKARRRAEEEARRAAEEEARRRDKDDAQRKEEEEREHRARRTAIQWVTIPGGSFMMGSERGRNDELPRHRVTVRTFQIAKTEVTWGQYQACVDAGACSPTGCESAGDDHAVACVNWNQAKVFSEWVGGRLPSEAEWEYAARSAGKDWEYPWGNEKADCSRAVVEDSRCMGNSTWRVCSKPAGNTAQGLCDMAGNVYEWTQDWYHGSYNGAPTNGGAWESPAGSGRVSRGGSWNSVPSSARSASRGNNRPDIRNRGIGFRPVR